jgi:protein phosphatase
MLGICFKCREHLIKAKGTEKFVVVVSGMFRRRTKTLTTPPASLSFTGAMLSHPGCVREANEDAVAYVLPAPSDLAGNHRMLAVVADGMGGHAAGEVASRIAADTVMRLYTRLGGSPPEVLAACLAEANRLICERSEAEAACAGMGTTCTVLAVRNDTAFLAHAGDSRAYLLRDGRLRQISEDHSLVAQLVRDGAITEEEAIRSPQRHVIVRALGLEPSVKPYISRKGVRLQAGDALVLCSDGLSDLVDDETIATTIARLPPAEACQELLNQALAAGGTDNISVGVFAVVSSQPAPQVGSEAARNAGDLP